MASPAAALPSDHELVPPQPEPQAVRACLTPDVAAEFDAEWEIVLDKAKASKDLAPVHELLAKWRHFAYAELRDPGSYYPPVGHRGAHAGHRSGAGGQHLRRRDEGPDPPAAPPAAGFAMRTPTTHRRGDPAAGRGAGHLREQLGPEAPGAGQDAGSWRRHRLLGQEPPNALLGKGNTLRHL